MLGTAVKAHRRPIQGLLPFQAWQRTLSHETVSLHCLAVYIHEQINGTFEDIFHQLSERGTNTKVTLEDAKLIVEDIGAHADELSTFL